MPPKVLRRAAEQAFGHRIGFTLISLNEDWMNGATTRVLVGLKGADCAR